MKRMYYSIAGVMIFLYMSSLGYAQPPEISLVLNIEQTSSGIGAGVKVSNDGDTDILINDGFSETAFFLKLRILDPVGNVIVSTESSGDNHPIGPVPVIYRDGRFIRAVSWETLYTDWQTISSTGNLMEHYLLSLPGYHCAQVQVSAMEFKAEDPGNVFGYKWQGVLKSNTACFYFEGATRVAASPEEWNLNWKDDKKKGKEIKIQIWPEDGMTVDDYQLDGIKLNTLGASHFKKTPSKIEVYFDAIQAIKTLGNVEPYQWYPVIVSGIRADGTSFGGSYNVQIVE